MTFHLAHRLTGKHLAVYPADLQLSPPESYFYVQDALIIFCGVVYTICYAYGIRHVLAHKFIDGPIECL